MKNRPGQERYGHVKRPKTRTSHVFIADYYYLIANDDVDYTPSHSRRGKLHPGDISLLSRQYEEKIFILAN